MGKRRIQVIGPDPERSQGGMATVIRNQLNSAELSSRYDISMHPSFVDGPLIKRAVFSCSQEFAFMRQAHDFDVYHVHICSGTSTWRKARYIRALGDQTGRVVLHVHGARYHEFFDGASEPQRARIRALYGSVGRVVVLSEEWLNVFVEREICDPEKIAVVYNAVEIPDDPGVDYAGHRVLFMGRLDERKNPDVLLRAAAELLPEYPDARFTFGGDGDVPKYRNLAAKLGIADSCSFLGWVSGKSKDRLFRSNDVYCLPSKNEGMPMSVLAMAYGLATVTTPVGGIPQVIRDGSSGLFVPVSDHVALADVLRELFDSEDARRSIGMAGRAVVKERFGMEAFTSKLAAIYEDVALQRRANN